MRVLSLTAMLLAVGCGGHERVPIGRDEPVAASCEVAGIDEHELTLLGPSDRSHWLQPWRAYRDTWPAWRMRRAAGFQAPFPPDPSWLTLLLGAGFRHVTMEVGWSRVSYDGPSDSVTAEVAAALQELADEANSAGLRPLLLLNAPGTSGPAKRLTLTLSSRASAGERTLHVSAQDAQQLTPHKALLTGEPPALVDNVGADGSVELSRPLPVDLPAGPVAFTLLRYAPFSRPTLSDGNPNPEFEETLGGWLAYLTSITGKLEAALGSDQLDVELWNETSPGNNYQMFDINTLYEPPLEADRPASFDENLNAIRARSIAWLRAPEHDLGSIGVSDGSGNMRFSVTAETEPPGMTALSRHVSAQGKRFPADAALGATPSVDALGQVNGALAGQTWVETFTPTYNALFPEQSLTALYPPDSRRPAQIVRDLSPLATSDVRGTLHERAALVMGAPSPDVWLTALSTNLGLSDDLEIPLTPADRLHLQAKALLRSFSAYVGKGAGLVSIYGPDQDTVRYFDVAEPQGGEALAALGRFFARFDSAADVGPLRTLELVSVSACAPGSEFEGDGSEGRPPLDHRKLVAFFPFQRSLHELVAPAYVMTRNLLKLYAGGSAPSRFDMAPETFELRLRGLAAETAHATAFDPLTNTQSVVALRRAGSDVVLQVALVDYPLILELGD